MLALENPYRLLETEVVAIWDETPTIKTLRLQPAEPLPFEAGQFIELALPGVGEAPFTPSSSASNPEVLEVTIMRVGRVTERIHQLTPGDQVGIRGPFGEGYPLDEFRGREVLVVGGGCGFAPVRSLMYALFERRGELANLFFRGGCRSPQEFLYRQEMDQWAKREDLDLELTVDVPGPGWDGPVGVVTEIVEGLQPDYGTASAVAVVCGPPIMMKFSVRTLLAMGFRAENMFLSMEENMSCGFGKCGHCRLDTYYICRDGPVFRYSDIRYVRGMWEF